VQVWVKTGSIHEDAHLGAGLSHFVEHMLFKGTPRRAGREISATVQAHGGYINAYTTFDRTVYYIDLPSEHTAVAIDVLADAVLHSTLPADEVTKEREVIAGSVPDDLLKLYDKLRQQQGGVGAARLFQRRCEGCRLELNITEVNEVKAAPRDAVLRCENCRRILVRTSESGL
jgi:hypothetical protein